MPSDAAWPWINRGFKLHTALYRATRGVIGHRFPGAPPMLLLDHVLVTDAVANGRHAALLGATGHAGIRARPAMRRPSGARQRPQGRHHAARYPHRPPVHLATTLRDRRAATTRSRTG